MGYTLLGLKNKIEDMYPEIIKEHIICTATFDEAQNAYIVKLKRGPHELTTYLDKKDADACMDGHVCISLGLQIAQFIANFKEGE